MWSATFSLIAATFLLPFCFSCQNGWRQSPIDPNKCYFISVSKKIWFEAESFCQNAAPNAHLTSIASAYETFSINGKLLERNCMQCDSTDVIDTPSISACDQMWIGANDFDQNGQFVWSDGKQLQYRNWGPGQPDLSNQCVSSQARTTGKWKTEPCGTENCFICESYSGSQTTPTTRSTTTSTLSSATRMTDCYDWLQSGQTTTGFYTIYPPGLPPRDVLCDMDTDGGGWTVFQKRVDGSIRFYDGTYREYQAGFGTTTNFWLGLDIIHVLSTKDLNVTLRMDVHGTRCPESQCGLPADGYWWSTFGFYVQDRSTDYTLRVYGPVMGNIFDDGVFSDNDGMQFQTIDHGEDTSCSSDSRNLGPMWHACGNYFFPNGRYDAPTNGAYSGLCVETFFGTNPFIYPIEIQMKLRKSH